ncbi:acetyl esterase/lipase [Actinoplanes lutulentus]|uniref:Acetyl esterase/lipase n=1 Tax=Actinoplanes lutulentus TaxID=1287878 RepID=A0A327ZAB6_9ACTN|nr:alpha/beta hydrolase [Actinoplanes lutulentus]MBB2947332.1 acetyl esterase/lipase [Actinoplanes lutulentus]RAK36607.1 acetyl esterase/lipase [Actinoplanes lutulentus]
MRFPATTKRSGPLGRFITRLVVRALRDEEGTPYDLAAARDSAIRMAGRFRLPKGISKTEEHIAGVRVVRFSSGNSTRGTVLALHGGAYVLGVPDSLSIQAWKHGGPDVVSVDYRLAPEHPYPAAKDDALAVYRALLDTVGADRLVVTGDSAGGGLALTLLQAAAAEHLPMPAALVAIYPWGDLSLSGNSATANRGRDILVHSQVAQAATWYAGDRRLDDPAISPLFGSFHGFPPTYMAIGTRDLILDDARRLAERMRADDVDVHLDIFDDAPHGFNAVPLAQGRQCNGRARALIDAALPPRAG